MTVAVEIYVDLVPKHCEILRNMPPDGDARFGAHLDRVLTAGLNPTICFVREKNQVVICIIIFFFSPLLYLSYCCSYCLCRANLH